LDRCDNIITEPEDRELEKQHIRTALQRCGYPDWTFNKVRQQKANKRVTSKDRKDHIGMVTLPYVQGFSEQLRRVFGSYDIRTAFKPVSTLRNALVHPKDKRNAMDNTGVVYKIPCSNCNKVYVGETGRKLSTRLSEHKHEVDILSQRHFTRSQDRASQHMFNKSAVTDHSVMNNHIIDWDNTQILDHDNNRETRWIRESLYIKQAGDRAMNREIGQFQLSDMYNIVLRKPNVFLRSSIGASSHAQSGRIHHF
jgi:hypothetical protein